MGRELAEGLAEGLDAAGVRRLFGVPGGGINLDLIGGAAARDIPFVLAHGETAACIMAASFGRASGTPGVATVTRGPGLTSAINGLAQATLDRFPLVLISDAVSAQAAPRVAHQRLDQAGLARPVSKWSGVVGAADPAGVAEAAARVAMARPSGGVSLSVDPFVPGDTPPAVAPLTAPSADAVRTATEMIARARRPVVIVGVDAVGHEDDVRAALGSLPCPELVTYEAKGVVPESWPTYAGLFTGALIELALLDQADLVIGIGLDPVEPIPQGWRVEAPVLLIGTHRVEAGYFGDATQVVGAYAKLLPELLDDVRSEWPAGAGAAAQTEGVARLEYGGPTLGPHEVVRTTRDVLGDALLTVDAGAHMLVAMPLWATDEAGSVLISNGLSTMGFALPAAIGLALAKPGRRVVCFTGDGGLGMVLAELETVVRLGLDLTVVVFDDAALTLIAIKQADGHGGEDAVRYRSIDFAAVARGMGLPATRVDDAGELRQALSSAGPGPLLVDAQVDPSCYPAVIRAIRG